MEEGGFTLVSNKKSKNKLKKCKRSEDHEEIIIEPVQLKRNIEKYKAKLENQTEIINFIKEIASEDFKRISLIVCYGLGKIRSCRIAQIQLAFLLVLLDYYKAPCYIYDPVFVEIDKSTLHTFNIKIIETNELGKRNTDGKKILFYMPHCDNFLYNNLLWANWSQHNIENLFIIGNNFVSIIQDKPVKTISKKYRYLYLSLKIIQKIPFPTIKEFYNIFNNTAFMSFQCSNDKDELMWNSTDEPIYSDNE